MYQAPLESTQPDLATMAWQAWTFTFCQSYFRHKAAQYWNSLLTDIKDHVQFSDFKSSAKTYLLSMLWFVFL